MKRFKKFNTDQFNSARIMTDLEMKHISGGYGWGMRSCTIYWCSGGSSTFGCDKVIPYEICIMAHADDPDFCGGGCFGA